MVMAFDPHHLIIVYLRNTNIFQHGPLGTEAGRRFPFPESSKRMHHPSPCSPPCLLFPRCRTALVYVENSGYTAEYFRVLKKGERIDADEKHLGWVVGEDGTVRDGKIAQLP